MSESFHMVRIPVHGPSLARIGGRASLGGRVEDMGYLAHCLFRETFGDQAPKPFAVTGSAGRWIEYLGYSDLSVDDLRSRPNGNRSGGPDPGIDLDGLSSKAMPSSFPEGAVYRFRVRACPVVRKARGSGAHRPGAEIDVFLAAVQRAKKEEPLDRVRIYEAWFRELWGRGFGAECVSVRVQAMNRSRLVRRGSDRKGRLMEKPDVIFEGHLRVTDPAVFRERIRRGVGRHRSFGFGMLLLRPMR